MAKICVHIQALPMVDKEVLASSIHWAFFLGRHTDHEILLSVAHRSSIDRGRNESARLALESESDYLAFLDDDMPILPHTFDSLIAADADIAMAHSYIRGWPYYPMCFKWTEGSGPHNPQGSKIEYFRRDEDLLTFVDPSTGLVPVAAVGFTCTLIKTSLLKKLQPPFFITSANGTEDVHFCLKAHFEQNDPVKVVVDTNVPTVHLGERERIGAATIEALREYHGHFMKKPTDRGDRDEKYLRMVESL